MNLQASQIDAHQHFWKLDRGDYGWLTPDLKPLYQDFLPNDLRPLMDANGVSGTILVQAAPTEAETVFMLGLASEHDFIKGVVGWTDFEKPNAAARIAEMSQDPKLVGLRPMVQDISDDEWMLKPEVSKALCAMIDTDLTFDALTLPRHLKPLLLLLKQHPELTVVVDHGSKPEIRAGRFQEWAKDIKAIATETQAYCKISGLVTEASSDWVYEDLAPYTDHLIEVFGPERLIWGSDWPVLTLAGTYDSWCAATDKLTAGLTAEQKHQIMFQNAQKAYRLHG